MKKLIYFLFITLFTMTAQPVFAAFPIAEQNTIETAALQQVNVAEVKQAKASKKPIRHDYGRKEKAATAAFGIAALSCAVAGLFILAIPLGVCAIVFGIIGMNKKMKGLAIAGLTLGLIDVILGIIIIAALM